jgi:hypothetical protein
MLCPLHAYEDTVCVSHPTEKALTPPPYHLRRGAHTSAHLLDPTYVTGALAAACHLLNSHENAEPDERLWPCKHSAASLIFEAM